MKVFKIEIRETLSEIIDVKANSIDEAISKTQQLYRNEKIILGSENHIDTEIAEFISEITFDQKKALINDVIEYIIDDEKRHFEEFESPPENHIYLKLIKLKQLLS
jgi:hypothetical protein